MSELTLEKLLKAREIMMEHEPVSDMYIPVEMFRKPKSKKKRIIRKWEKDFGNWRVPKWFNDATEEYSLNSAMIGGLEVKYRRNVI